MNLGALISGGDYKPYPALEIETVGNGFIVSYNKQRIIEPPAPPRPGKSKMTMKLKTPVLKDGEQEDADHQEMEIFAEDLTQQIRGQAYTTYTRERKLFKATEKRALVKFLREQVEAIAANLLAE